MYKFYVFVPIENKEQVKESMFKAGAGELGNYSHCCFETEGLGQFRPLKNANPSIGTLGNIEFVKEVKIETLVPKHLAKKVFDAIKEAHPYEEPAIDIIELSSIVE